MSVEGTVESICYVMSVEGTVESICHVLYLCKAPLPAQGHPDFITFRCPRADFV